MNTIICPKCGTENSADALNCKQCRINLKFALEHPEEIEHIKQGTQREQVLATTSQQRTERRFRLLAYVLTLLLFAGSITILIGIVMWMANGPYWEVVDGFEEAFAERPVSGSIAFLMLLLFLFAGCLRVGVWLSGVIIRFVGRSKRE